MKNPICISTGLVYKLTNDRNEMIKMIKEFSPDGIELSFAHPQYLFDFKIRPENLDYLKTLDYVSIHSPWKEITYGDNQKSRDVLSAIERLYEQVNARNVVFHKKQAEDIEAITNYKFTASIENDGWSEEVANSVEKIESILKSNPKLKFTFDFAHALTVSANDVPAYINKFKDKLIQIHVSMLSRELKDHWFLHKYDSKKIGYLLGQLKHANCPFILECVAADAGEVELIKEEIRYLRSV